MVIRFLFLLALAGFPVVAVAGEPVTATMHMTVRLADKYGNVFPQGRRWDGSYPQPVGTITEPQTIDTDGTITPSEDVPVIEVPDEGINIQ